MSLSPAELTNQIALFQSQVLGNLFGTGGSVASGDIFSSLLSQKIGDAGKASDPTALLAQASGLSPKGRNTSLFDPESAYKMMSLINNRDVLYKAQYAELHEMKGELHEIQGAAEGLAGIRADTPLDQVAARLQGFVDQYNAWRSEFNTDIADGGLLDNVQAAEVSLYELEQSVKNRFFGAQEGGRGLESLGITLDPHTGMASLDADKLRTAFSTNLQGAVSTIQDFSTNFAKSAMLLTSKNNFVLNQLDNLGRAIHYISDNKTSLTQEFGTGDTAKPTGKVAQALAAYNALFTQG